jgi:hypothetical protein
MYKNVAIVADKWECHAAKEPILQPESNAQPTKISFDISFHGDVIILR